MIVIIRAELSLPPTWFTSFRDLTLYVSVLKDVDILVEATKTETDQYYDWLRERGGMDFVEDFVLPNSETGVRLDTVVRGYPTIQVDRIVPENVQELIYRFNMFT